MSTKYTSKLASSRILIFGGTSGLGYCVAEASLEAGATVIISGSRQPKIDDKIAKLLATYPDAKDRLSGHACDLTDEAGLDTNLQKLLNAATDNGNAKLDHIVWTAGDAFELKTLKDTTPEYIHKCSTVRFVAPLLLAKTLQSGKGGYIKNASASSITLTGGVNSTQPGPGWSVLAGVGAAIEGLTRGLAVDLKPVRVNMVSPGAVHTELMESVGADRLEDILELYRKKTLTGQIGRPEDVAESYMYSMRDRFVTGTVLHSNGGHLLT